MKHTKQTAAIWTAIALLFIALIVAYMSLSLKIQDTEKRVFEALQTQRVEINSLKR